MRNFLLASAVLARLAAVATLSAVLGVPLIEVFDACNSTHVEFKDINEGYQAIGAIGYAAIVVLLAVACYLDAHAHFQVEKSGPHMTNQVMAWSLGVSYVAVGLVFLLVNASHSESTSFFRVTPVILLFSSAIASMLSFMLIRDDTPDVSVDSYVPSAPPVAAGVRVCAHQAKL